MPPADPRPPDSFGTSLPPDTPPPPGPFADPPWPPADTRTPPTADLTPAPGPGAVPDLPGYTLIRPLGRGGMGVVYLARDQRLSRDVAVKLVLGGAAAGPESLVRFLAEAEALAALHHPNVVQVYGRGEHQGAPYLCMEFCPGGSLADKVREHPLPPREAARVAEQLARGIAAAHRQGILHRDLKPANVLLAADGTPKLTDFGLAKRFTDAAAAGGLTQTGTVLGTPNYMAPEQAAGDTKTAGPAADVYGLGALLYHLLTGRPPFLGATPLDTLKQVLEVEPVGPATLSPGVPRDLSTICLKCLAKEPRKRYAGAGELADDLHRFLAGEPIAARPVGSLERAAKWVRRNPVVAGAAAAVALSLLAGTVVSYLKYREAEEQGGIARREAADAETARRAEAERVRDLNYQLGISDFMLGRAAYDEGDVRSARERLARVPAAQRAWEWDYLTRQCDGGIFTLSGHTAGVNGVAFSPDGGRLATGGDDQTARVWDARTGQLLVELKHSAAVNGVAFSPDGRRVLTAGDDRTARLWDARTGARLLEFAGHTDRVLGVAFSPDGTRVAAASWDRTARVWDAATGSPLLVLTGHTNAALGVAFSPDGDRVATGGMDQTVRVWDARTGSPLLTLTGHRARVSAVTFSPDGGRLATASSDWTARVWDAWTGEPVVTLTGHGGPVFGAAFGPDGMRVATASSDRTARLWDARTGSLLLDLRGHTDPVAGVAFSPDGTQVATAGGDRTARLWDARVGAPVVEFRGHPGVVTGAAFSPDGEQVVTAGGGEIDSTRTWDKLARVWDARATPAAPVRVLRGHRAGLTSAAFSPDGTRVLTASWDETARLWDARTGEALLDLEGHADAVFGAAFSPDGRRVVTASRDETARVWDAGTGDSLRELAGHAGFVFGAAFSPDGGRVVTASADRTARVWDAATGEVLAELRGHEGIVNAAAFSPDGGRVVTAGSDRLARVWDARTGRPLLDLTGHASPVSAATFSPDGRRVLTASLDRTARVWDARTGAPLLVLRGHTDKLSCAAFSPDGRRIVTASDGENDGTARVWDARDGGGLEYRLDHTRPTGWRYYDGYLAAKAVKDPWAAAFWLDRRLSVEPGGLHLYGGRTGDPRLVARTGFHTPDLAKKPYDRDFVRAAAASGDRLARRLVAQELVRDGKPDLAVPLLYDCLLTRPVTDPPKPPVEELLLAQAYLSLTKPEQARRFYKAAADWLDRPRGPMRAAGVVTHALNPWAALGKAVEPVDDPRYDPFEWEAWRECDVFRARVEKALESW